MNLFSITSIIIFVSSVGFGLSLYAGNRKSNVNSIWFLFSIFIGLWSLGLFGVTWSSNEKSALIWQYVLDISAIFIPVIYFSFASELVGLNNHKWRLVSYFAAFCMSLFSLSPLFKIGMKFVYNSFYWVDPGPAYIIFPIFFLAYVFICIVIYISAYKNNTDKAFRSQMISMVLASLVGFGGGLTNFLPQVLNIYPFGNFLVLLYLFLMSYGVLKYKFISKKILSTQLLIGATVLVFLFNFLQMLETNSIATEQSILISFLLLVLVSIFGIFVVRSVYREVSQREKIQTLATELEKANQRLTELDRQKSEFVSFATHQLRAPLTAMKGYASLLLEGDMGELPDKAKMGIEHIFESSKTLTNIVDDYLNISRIELGTMKYAFDTIDLKLMIQNVIDELKPNIDKTGLAFTFEAEPIDTSYRMTADRDKLKQVIANLIDNSVKYTPSGRVDLTLSYDRKIDRYIFKIHDTGVGIPPETLPHLFQKFSRAENAGKTNIRGTGLGLYVARQILEAHQGAIRAESPGEGRGATFIVELAPLGKV